MRKKRILFFCAMLSLTINAQQKTVEQEYHDCYFNSLPDKGVQLKKMAKAFEAKLIENKILPDNSSESYLKMFQKVLREESIRSVRSYSFIDSVNSLSYADDLIHMNAEMLRKSEKKSRFQ